MRSNFNKKKITVVIIIVSAFAAISSLTYGAYYLIAKKDDQIAGLRQQIINLESANQVKINKDLKGGRQALRHFPGSTFQMAVWRGPKNLYQLG